MIYRCRNCEHEESRGCLPSVTSGLYLIFLMGLFVAVGFGVFEAIRVGVGLRPAPVQPAGTPWWGFGIAMVVGLPMTLVGAAGTKFLLELAEYLAFARRRCPKCAARRWSWGHTRGFGL